MQAPAGRAAGLPARARRRPSTSASWRASRTARAAPGRTARQRPRPGPLHRPRRRGQAARRPALDRLPADPRGLRDGSCGRREPTAGRPATCPTHIVEGWQQLVKDFAYWRVRRLRRDATGQGAAHKAWLAADRAPPRGADPATSATWAHFVGDGSQPLHVTVHFNGWGDFPNPKGFTQERIHGPFEGDFVIHNVKFEAVRAAMRPPAACGSCDIAATTSAYLTDTHRYVEPVYQMWKDGELKDGNPKGAAFVTARLADGAAELRDLVTAAWNASRQDGRWVPGRGRRRCRGRQGGRRLRPAIRKALIPCPSPPPCNSASPSRGPSIATGPRCSASPSAPARSP